LKKSFENVTGMTLPSFDDVKKGITTLGTNLKNKFKDKTGIEIPSLDDIGKKIKDMIPDLGNPLKKLAAALHKSAADGGMLDFWPMNKGMRALASVVENIAGRAAGGPVEANKIYLVGEKGPELVVPSAAGTVIPNHKIGGGDERMMRVLEALTTQLAAGSGGNVDASSVNISSAPTTTIGGSVAPRQRVAVSG